MTYVGNQPCAGRVRRTCFAGFTPAVLRYQDGRRISGKLQVVSVTGGLLRLSRPLEQGLQVKLMFLTGRGSVLGGAELLSPISWNLQPFKFIELGEADQQKLEAAIQLAVEQRHLDQGRMETHRAW